MSRIITFLLLSGSLLVLNAADKITRHEYIRTYYKIAIEEMQSYGIPASITMAQGILESGDGNSRLALEGRNHFGIKCHDWTGASIYKDDDKKDECFRKYELALESFHDHSDFLKDRSRYAFLFDYKGDDYKAWSKGLKKAGYATNPNYPKLLIKIIEDNELYLLDEYASAKKPNEDDLPWYIKDNSDIAMLNHNKTEGLIISNSDKPTSSTTSKEYSIKSGSIRTSDNGVDYVIMKKDMTLEDVASANDIHTWEVYKFNDVKRGQNVKPTEGQRVYIENKRLKGSKSVLYHKVQNGDTMYSISQQYGIRMKSLYRLNRMDMGTQPLVGSKLSLHKRVAKR